MHPARDFILNTIEHYYDKTNLKVEGKPEETLQEFINNSQSLLIQTCVWEDKLLFNSQIQKYKTKSLIFYKISSQPIVDENGKVFLEHINIITLSNNAAESLYHTLKQVYTPLLTAENDVNSIKLQKYLSDLEALLKTLTHGKGADNNVNIIFNIQDEIDYWQTIGQKKDVTKTEKEAVSTFCDLFQDVSEEIRVMQSSSVSDMRESAENIGGLLDDVWRYTIMPYSQHRMTHIFDIVGHFICSLLQKTLSTIDIWKMEEANEYEILNLLSESLKVIQTWTSACKSLTETYWPNYALHPWNCKPYVPLFCQKFEGRLKKVLEIRSTHNQLNKLLTKSEKTELQTHSLFAPFESTNVWMCNGPNTCWETAVSKFSASLRPAEAKIAEKLKPRLHNTSTKQMLYEFMRYQSLIERPLVKHALNNELEIFVSCLLSMLKNIQNQLDGADGAVPLCHPAEMSLRVLRVQWAKQMEAKVKEVHTCAEKYLKEFEGSSQVLNLATQLLKELKTMYTQLHEEWSRDLQVQAKNGLLSLSTNKPVVEFSSESKMMEVVFNPRLVWAELEARSLAALGLPPPPAAAALDSIAAALTQARALQQVASFHNTLGERMIPSTRPMMLLAALELSSLVQNQKAVYWDDTEQLASYTDKLKMAVLKLESQNSYLTSQHVAIRNIVEKLMDTELLAKQSEWKKGVKDIREIIEKVEALGHKSTDLWRSHWDWQLYKALECQYVRTLLSLHKHFPHVKVDLVLRGHSVRTEPPPEQLRVLHYQQLRRLVALPARFVGVQHSLRDNNTIFTAIVDKHGWLGNKAVSQLEEALSSLERTCKAWTRRAALACMSDLEALCTDHLKEPQDWEVNFKACKAYGQAIAKMTFEDEKIHWISVGTITLRREFEAQTRSLWACLISTLQASCRNDATDLDAFIANATVTLENRALPKNAKELAEISSKQQALQQKMPEMEKTMEALIKKGHMLRTWGGDASVDGTIKEWQKIRELMLSHQQMFEHQAEIVKSSIKGEWENLNTGVEVFVSRWSQAKSRLEQTQNVPYNEMAERCRSVFEAREQWETFVADKNELLKECDKFSMNIELTESWTLAEKLINGYVELWTIFKDYNEEFNSMADQDWLIFQKKLHLLDEFTTKWRGRLEPFTVITLFIQQELDKYVDLSTLLKYVRGSDFTERHWREVFGLVEMEYKKPETLVLKDWLCSASTIKKHIKALQKICSSASSESAVRSALNELEMWFAGARLNIIYYNDKGKRQTPIVKDFKDILNKIEEQQWAVSSLAGGEEACGPWEGRLRAARALCRATHHAQRRWLYLEPILSNDDGELGAKFRKVDQGFRQVTRILESDSRLSALLQSTRLQPMLDSISEQLLACQSALNQYIDDKRSVFPRLYFLSDDDLLELLGQARAGADGRDVVMQTHLKKLFPGTTGVRLGPGDMSITAMCSQHGETFQLEHPVDIDCPVEVWLKNLESEMRSSLKNMTLKCVVTNSLQEQDPFTLPTQILCLAQNLRFTEQAERAITSRDLHKLKVAIEKENLYYVSADVDNESERHKKQALILQCAHYVSVLRILIEKNVTSTNDWLWQKQLRFYLMGTKEVVAKMGLAHISYSYEYLGVNTGQFVRTELADECFLILTQSLHLGLVGNPFGPAGTGKTESVKALGGLVGRLVLIFNCDEAMDAECMGRLLSGLALCGAWGCFDEFNRLAADTLAAVSHQLGSLLAASQHKSTAATLNGKQISVSEWCGVAATMNPAGRGYGGRRTLPAALERVLRPIAMLQPRGDRLAAHLLAARCVLNAEPLAADLHNVFTMASALLSAQRHYDWGLRALKAAVGSCGAALQPLTSHPLESQRACVRRVLALNNLSKLTRHDAERFENILSLVFSDVPVEKPASDPIAKAIEASMDSLKLARNNTQVQKCVELHEQLKQRMGVVVVGPPGSGKSTIRRLLKNALTQEGKNIVEYIICPKAMSRDWLLGNIDHDTRQWTDGVISATALEVSNQTTDVWSWVVCDGDIDPEWIEALNSVLDDNRLLSLPSGWRVQFAPNVNFIFETHSLEHASPATVSRLGVILLSEDVSCELDTLNSWTQKADIENEIAKSAVPLLCRVVRICLQWFSLHKSDLLLKLCNMTLVKQILMQFEYTVQNLAYNSARTSPEEIVYEAVERSVTDLVKEKSVSMLHEELSSILGPPPPPPVLASEWVTDSLLMSPRLACCEPILRACLASDQSHILIVGPDACAKNLLAEYVVKECNSTIIAIDCTPILEPSDIIAELRRNNVVRSGARGSAHSAARVCLLVRALHRARLDDWGSSAVHSFLLQLIEYGGFWSVGGGGSDGLPVWSRVSPVCVVGTSARGAAPPRLAARLARAALREPDDDELLELTKIWLKQNADKNIKPNDIAILASTVLGMYKEVTDIFNSRPQYKWNASHLKRWCNNVKWYSLTNMEELITAIAAEANIIFRDRLETNEDRSRFNKISRSYLKVDNDYLYYTCRLKGDGVYMESVDYGAWHQTTQKLINQCLSEYEQNVFGESGAEVCSELAILCPATARASNGGMLVCVGSAGVGRRAAALITAAALPASLQSVYHLSQFYTCFKNAVASSGEGTRTLVFVGESAVNKTTLAYIEALRSAESTHSIPASMMPSVLHQHMMENIKQNLGIIICLDKRQSDLSELMEEYPMLYNDGHFVWLARWSDNTLKQMPTLVIQRLMKESVADSSKEQMEAIPTDGFVKIYNSLDADSLKAPCRYVNFIKSYYNIVNRKTAALSQRQSMLSSGVEALRKARSEVATLQAEATQQEALLSEKQAKANSALDQISATVRANTDKKEEMHALKVNIEGENDQLQIQKKEIEAELASVEPVIAAARAAVGDLKPESLSEVRSLRAPPDVVRDVLEGVLRLMGIADTSWSAMKNFLSKRGVKEDIRCLDASQISPAALQSVQRLLEQRGASFAPGAARRASAACAPLAAWVRANVEYARALQRVQPLQLHQARLLTNLQEAEDQLSALASGLASVDQRVFALKEQLGQHTRDAAAVEVRLAAAAATLLAARTLLAQLAREYTAWDSDLENIIKEIAELSQRSLLAAAYIVYLPDRTEPQAREYIKMWSKLIGFKDTSFSVINFLSSTEQQLQWDADGLPSDQSAVKNAVIIHQALDRPKCGLTPLLIDPDGEGLLWLRSTLADVPCDFVSQHSDNLTTVVQYAVRLGRVLVITDVDELHDSWSVLLGGAARVVLQGGDVGVWRRLPPHAADRLSPAHFTPRLDGLTDQLIHYALQQQNPEISGKSKEMKIQKAKLQKQQHELQESLLRDLSTAGDVLHDATLLTSLNQTRETDATISQALEAAREIERANAEACAKYSPSAKRAATLALAVKGLAGRWPLVALPVDAVLTTFVDAVTKVDTSNHNEIVKYISRRIIERVLLALHKKDKYIVVLYLLKQVYEDLMPDKLWQLLIGTSEINEDNLSTNDIKKSHPWIPDECIKSTAKLKASDGELYGRLNLNDVDLWNRFVSSGELSDLSKLKLSPFEAVVAVAAVRPASLYRAITAFVDHVLGAGSVLSSSPVRSAARCARGRPVLLLAAHAADVVAAHASSALIHTDVEQGPAAWRSALASARSGGWLVLTVAASPFTRELQAFITELAEPSESFNEEFQVWIVSEYRDIPPLVANACVNVILEAPEGVKNNILGTLSAWGQSEGDPKTVRLLASLAVFHALVQERRAYIPQGWSRWYSWEWGEVSASVAAIRAGGAALCLPLYAARVQLPPDGRLLAALHARCLSAAACPLPFALPVAPTLQPFASAVSGLPEADSPQLLGLPANCRGAWEGNAAKHIIAVLKELETTVSVNEKDDGASLKALLGLWKKNMSGCSIMKDGGGSEGGAGWWGCVVGAEVGAAGRGARALHAALAQLAGGARSHVPREVPEEWQLVWAGPGEVDAYLREFCHRAKAAAARADTPTAREYMPTEVDLRSFLRPARPVWALRARTLAALQARPAALALVGRFTPTEENSTSEAAGLVLVGLRVSGAGAGRGGLRAAGRGAPPHAAAPPLHVHWAPQSKDGASPEGTFEVPVYSNESREDMLFSVSVPLAPGWARDAATLNAVALFIAVLD